MPNLNRASVVVKAHGKGLIKNQIAIVMKDKNELQKLSKIELIGMLEELLTR